MIEYLAGKQPTITQLSSWIESFHKQGFLVIPNVLPPEQCQQLRDDLDEVPLHYPSDVCQAINWA